MKKSEIEKAKLPQRVVIEGLITAVGKIGFWMRAEDQDEGTEGFWYWEDRFHKQITAVPDGCEVKIVKKKATKPGRKVTKKARGK